LADACREMGGADPDRLAKRLVDADVLAVSSISEAVAHAAVKDIVQLLGEAPRQWTAPPPRGHGEKLLEVLKRLAAGRVNPGPPHT
jgi:hypothetical protein